jgi:hypothetical protein
MRPIQTAPVGVQCGAAKQQHLTVGLLYSVAVLPCE